ncbi:cation efflux transmembrane transport protein, putative, partial [Bodo saltans]
PPPAASWSPGAGALDGGTQPRKVGGVTTSARQKRKRHRNRRVLFEDFEKLIELWQSAARFQLFEKRSDETEARLQATMEHKFLATDCAAMWVWQLIMLFVGCYLVMVPVAVFTNTVEERAQYFALYTPFDAIVTILIAADMILKCCTCVTKHVNGVAVVVDDLRGIMREYVRSPWFWIDLVVLLPWRFTVLAGGKLDYFMRYDNTTGLLVNPHDSGCLQCRTVSDYRFALDIGTALLLLRALKFLEHYRYFEETGLIPLTRNYIRRQYVVGMGLIQVARFIVLVHTLAVIYLAVFTNSVSTGAKSRSSCVEYASATAGDANLNASSSSSVAVIISSCTSTNYAGAMYLVLYCMATVGFGDIPPQDDNERKFLMLLIVIGWLFNAYIIGSLVGFFQTSDIETERQSKLLELSTLLEHFEVPPSLMLEILSFEDYLLANSIKKSFGHIVNDLPLDMQRNEKKNVSCAVLHGDSR